MSYFSKYFKTRLALNLRFIPCKANNIASEKAILVGGFFWGMEELIRELPGVKVTVVRYTGDDVENATYCKHGMHAEAIAITFDPLTLLYRKLLEFFLQIHNLTTKNRHGNDMGTFYGSAIFYLKDDKVINTTNIASSEPAPIL